MKKLIVSLFFLIFSIYKSKNAYISKLIETLDNKNGKPRLVDFIDKGAMNGFLLLNEFWNIVHELQIAYPHFISVKLPLGKTKLGRDINSFYVGSNLVNTFMDYTRKNVIYFTALEKSSEPITLSMLYYIFLNSLHQVIHSNAENFFWNNIIWFLPAKDIDNYLNINEMFGKIDWIRDYIHFQKNNLYYRCFNDFGNNPFKTLSPVCSFEKINEYNKSYFNIVGKINLTNNLVSGINLHSDFDVFVYPEPWLYGLPNKQLKHWFNNVNHLYLQFKRNIFGPAPKFDIKGYMNLINNNEINNFNNPNNYFNNYMSRLFPNLDRIEQIVKKNFSVIYYFLRLHIIKIILKKVEIFKLNYSDVVNQFDCIHKRQPNILKFNFFNKSISTAYNLKWRIQISKKFLNNLMKINLSTKKDIHNFKMKTIGKFNLAITESDVWMEQEVIIGGKSSLYLELMVLSMRIPINIKFYFLENNIVIKEFNYKF